MFWFFLSLAILTDFLLLFFAKKFYLTGEKLFFILTILFSSTLGIIFCKLLEFRNLAIANILWTALSIIFGVLTGILFFSEKITIIQMIEIY